MQRLRFTEAKWFVQDYLASWRQGLDKNFWSCPTLNSPALSNLFLGYCSVICEGQDDSIHWDDHHTVLWVQILSFSRSFFKNINQLTDLWTLPEKPTGRQTPYLEIMMGMANIRKNLESDILSLEFISFDYLLAWWLWASYWTFLSINYLCVKEECYSMS